MNDNRNGKYKPSNPPSRNPPDLINDIVWFLVLVVWFGGSVLWMLYDLANLFFFS